MAESNYAALHAIRSLVDIEGNYLYTEWYDAITGDWVRMAAVDEKPDEEDDDPDATPLIVEEK